MQAAVVSSPVSPTLPPEQMAKMKGAARDFETFFLNQMLEHMFSTVTTDSAFGGGNSEKVYRSMMLSEYSKDIAQQNTTGLQDSLVAQMVQLQAQANNGGRLPHQQHRFGGQ